MKYSSSISSKPLNKSLTITHIKDEHRKHRHHHCMEAVHYGGRRDIDHSWHVLTKDGIYDNDDHLLDARESHHY